MTKLRWRVKLVAECEPGVTTEPEFACIERNAQASVADLGLTLAETKRLTAALQVRLCRRKWWFCAPVAKLATRSGAGSRPGAITE